MGGRARIRPPRPRRRREHNALEDGGAGRGRRGWGERERREGGERVGRERERGGRERERREGPTWIYVAVHVGGQRR